MASNITRACELGLMYSLDHINRGAASKQARDWLLCSCSVCMCVTLLCFVQCDHAVATCRSKAFTWVIASHSICNLCKHGFCASSEAVWLTSFLHCKPSACMTLTSKSLFGQQRTCAVVQCSCSAPHHVTVFAINARRLCLLSCSCCKRCLEAVIFS